MVAGCAGAGGGGSARPSLPFASASPAPTPRGPDAPAATPPAVSVVPQSLIDQMLEQAARLASVPVEDLTVESAEAVTWPDGSLGCPEPGMMYTQALVDGYRVVIGLGDQRFDFRGSGSTFRLCADSSSGGPKRSIEIPPPL